MKPEIKRNADLDALRAISVLLVVFSHAGFSQLPGGLGVTIFFVISGFIITKLIVKEIQEHENFLIGKFYYRRFWKIFPPFFIITMIPSLIFWQKNDINLGSFLSQIFFYFNWKQVETGTAGVLPGSSVVWSLSIEEQFYLVIAILIYLLTKLNKKNLEIHLISILTLVWIYSTLTRVYLSLNNASLLAYNETGNLPRIYFGTDTRMSSICAGGILAIIFSNPRNKLIVQEKIKKRLILTLVASQLLIISSIVIRDHHFRDTFRFTIQEIAISWVIICGPILNILPRKLRSVLGSLIFQIMGKASYCIYLSHLSIMINLRRTDFYLSNLNSWQTKVLLAIISIIIGTLLYFITDKPFETIRQRFRR